MFENFSFQSPSSTADGDDRLKQPDYDSTSISPLSSRSPSPSSYLSRRSCPLSSHPRSSYLRRPQQPPTSMPSNYEQFQRRISVGTLTERLNAHTLNPKHTRTYEPPSSPLSPTSFSFSVTNDSISSRGSSHTLLTPPGEYEDGEFDEQLEMNWESQDTTQFTPSLTSIPLEDDGLLHPPDDVPHRFPRHPYLRLQRQQLSRAQCSIDVLKLAFIAEDFSRRSSESTVLSDDECHPSSLPPDISPSTIRRSSVKPRGASGSLASGSGILRRRSRLSSPTEPGMVRRRSTPSTGTFVSSSRITKVRSHDLLSKKRERAFIKTEDLPLRSVRSTVSMSQ